MLRVLLSLATLMTVSAVQAQGRNQDFPCIDDGAICTGKPSVSLNGLTMCCPPYAAMSIVNSQCVCQSMVPMDEPCRSGPSGCREAVSFTTDPSGVLRCCLPRYHMTYTPNANATEDPCRCSPSQNGGFVSSFMGLGNGGGGMSGVMSMVPGPSSGSGMVNQGRQNANNGTDPLQDWRRMGQEWKKWGQQFTRGFHTFGRNFGQRMSDTGRGLARDLSGVLQTSLTRTAVPIQRAVSDMIGNLFRSIPRF